MMDKEDAINILVEFTVSDLVTNYRLSRLSTHVKLATFREKLTVALFAVNSLGKRDHFDSFLETMCTRIGIRVEDIINA